MSIAQHPAASKVPGFLEQSAPDPADRRRRKRVNGRTPGWLMPESGGEDAPREVTVLDVSRLGVGFLVGAPLFEGETVRVRIGLGPLKLARRARVKSCRRERDAMFKVGAEFF
ncbi:MAG: hypothetical protein ACREIT_09150 [Tepidisphaeraceae bacterium]